MLQNGTPGNMVLLESDDLRDMDNHPMAVAGTDPHDWYLYTFEDEVLGDERYYWNNPPRQAILTRRSRASLFTNVADFPPGQFKFLEEIRSVDISAVPFFITEVGCGFLEDCTLLQAVDLSPLFNVTVLGFEFMSMCIALKSIDLSPLARVTVVGLSFMKGCVCLESIDLSPFSNVTEIEGAFLLDCEGLKRIDCSPLSRVVSVGECFMYGCTSLEFIDLSMPSLVTIEDPPDNMITKYPLSFLYSCPALRWIDMSGMAALNAIPHEHIARFEGIATLLLPPHLSSS